MTRSTAPAAIRSGRRTAGSPLGLGDRLARSGILAGLAGPGLVGLGSFALAFSPWGPWRRFRQQRLRQPGGRRNHVALSARRARLGGRRIGGGVLAFCEARTRSRILRTSEPPRLHGSISVFSSGASMSRRQARVPQPLRQAPPWQAFRTLRPWQAWEPCRGLAGIHELAGRLTNRLFDGGGSSETGAAAGASAVSASIESTAWRMSSAGTPSRRPERAGLPAHRGRPARKSGLAGGIVSDRTSSSARRSSSHRGMRLGLRPSVGSSRGGGGRAVPRRRGQARAPPPRPRAGERRPGGGRMVEIVEPVRDVDERLVQRLEGAPVAFVELRAKSRAPGDPRPARSALRVPRRRRQTARRPWHRPQPRPRRPGGPPR